MMRKAVSGFHGTDSETFIKRSTPPDAGFGERQHAPGVQPAMPLDEVEVVVRAMLQRLAHHAQGFDSGLSVTKEERNRR